MNSGGGGAFPSSVDDVDDDPEAVEDPVGVAAGLNISTPPNRTCRDAGVADVDWLGGGLYLSTPPNVTRCGLLRSYGTLAQGSGRLRGSELRESRGHWMLDPRS